jgi:hypothetical protein
MKIQAMNHDWTWSMTKALSRPKDRQRQAR